MNPRKKTTNRTKPQKASQTAPPGSQNSVRVLHHQLLAAFVLIILIIVAYAPIYHAGYVWDDKVVYENPLLRSTQGLIQLWQRPASMAPYEIHYWPLVHSMFWIEYHLWGDTPLGYHLVNLALHLFNALILWRLLSRIRFPGAWFAALLFGVHPLHVESVAWITERKDVLSAFFYLLAFLCFVRFNQKPQKLPWYFATIALFGCALLSKSIAITLPAAILLWLWCSSQFRFKQLIWLLPMFIIALIYGLFDLKLAGTGERLDFAFSFLQKVLIAGRAFWFYLLKVVIPYPLMAVYDRWEINYSAPLNYIFPVGLMSLLWFLWLKQKRIGKLPFATIAYFLITLAPTLGLLEFGYMRHSFVANRFAYLAITGPIILGVHVSQLCLVNKSLKLKRVAYVVGGSIIGIFCVITWQQAALYKDKETLFNHTLKHNPNAYIAHYNLATELAKRNQDEEAIAHYERVIAIAPRYGDVYHLLGNLYVRTGAIALAEKAFAADIQLRPKAVNSYINLGNAQLRLAKLSEAISTYKQALTLSPDNPKALNNLGFAYAQTGNFAGAIDCYQRSLKSNPYSYETTLNLARSLLAVNRFSEAVLYFRRTLAFDPNQLEALNNLAWILATSHLPEPADEAICYAEQACRLTNYLDASTLDSLAAAYANANQFGEALTTLSKAIALADKIGDIELLLDLHKRQQLYEQELPYKAN